MKFTIKGPRKSNEQKMKQTESELTIETNAGVKWGRSQSLEK